ncbi:MAG: nucleoside triphosphate pyrophosphohydrolase family protein [Burkholderiales bacterium]|nr:nucleoside triphosphate pyrophosphohydrolase family protein [Burkholderiales bacterium]
MPPARPQGQPLTLAEYAISVDKTNRFAGVPDGGDSLAFGFFGEIGSLLSALKKVHRDKRIETQTEVAAEEIGDALWYLVAVCRQRDVELESIGRSCFAFLHKRLSGIDHHGDGQFAFNFRQVDGLIDAHESDREGQRMQLLGELARKSGEVVGHDAAYQLSLGQLTAAELLGQLFAMLALVAGSFRLKLEDVARANMDKTHGRWPGDDRIYAEPFDTSFKPYEQLPRLLPIVFEERGSGKDTHVVQRLFEVNIGDRLTDNSTEPDDYRFHDVFHLAYIAHLGWSPVIRALLKYKRKSDSAIDQNQDGARAMIIEEGIATWVFGHAKRRDFYADVELGKLEYGILKQVRDMVEGYEVEACPMWQWEAAILDGFRVFRELRKPENRGGTVIADMIAHTLTFVAPEVPRRLRDA